MTESSPGGREGSHEELVGRWETLCQVEGSLLSSQFSGRWEKSVKRTEDGSVFLDYDPDLFALTLTKELRRYAAVQKQGFVGIPWIGRRLP